MRSADTLSSLVGDMWIDFFFLHPLLEVDRCRYPCGPSSCFKLPVVAVLQRRSSFPFCACFTFFRCLSPVWSFFASCLGNIHLFLMPFTSLFPPFEYWTNLICISCSLRVCFASVLLKIILFFSVTEKGRFFITNKIFWTQFRNQLWYHLIFRKPLSIHCFCCLFKWEKWSV